MAALRWGRELAFAALVALMGAGLGSGARVTFAEAEARGGIEVPVGSIGDAIRYIGSEKVLGRPLPASTVDWTLRVEGVSTSLDKTGAELAALTVLAQAGDDPNVTSRYALALDSRAAIRWDHFAQRRDVIRLDPMIVTEFGPSFKGNWMQRWEWRHPMTPFSTPVDLTFFGLQGASLRLGAPLPDAAAATFWKGSGLARPGMNVSGFDARVDAFGNVDGRDALRITIQGAFSWTEPKDEPEASKTTIFLWWRVPAATQIRFERELWLPPGSAYPATIRDRITMPNGTTTERHLGLVGSASGSTPIPWRATGTALLAPPAPLLAPAPLGSIPADGGSTICYRLEDALRDQYTSGEGSGYTTWSATHPVNYPTTAIGNCQLPPGGWLLEYWTPDGHKCRYSIAPTTDRKLSQSYAENVTSYQSKCVQDVDVDARRSFDPDELATPRVTTAWAERLWRRATYTQLAEMDINFVEWGRVVGTYERSDPIDATRVLLVGRRHLTAPDGSVGTPTATEVQSAYIVVHVETGELLGGQHALQGRYLTTHLVDRKLLELLSTVLPMNQEPFQEDMPAVHLTQSSAFPVASVAGSVAALAVAALLYFSPLLKFLGFQVWHSAFGYARLHREEVLENAHRQRILDRVRDAPGTTPPEIARDLQLAWSTLVYHLTVLEKQRLVSSHVDGRHKYFFPVGEVDHGVRPALAVLRNQRTRAIYDLLETEPGLARDDVARRIQFSIPAAVWHLERLQRVGLVGADKVGRRLRYYVAGAASAPESSEVT